MVRLAILVSICALALGGAAAKPLDPQRWRDEYIADPARKAVLERYTAPMEKETYTALRTLELAKLIATRCRGSTFEPDIVRDYISESGLGLPAAGEPRGGHWIAVEPFLIDVDGRTRALDRDAVPRRPPPAARQTPPRHAAAPRVSPPA